MNESSFRDKKDALYTMDPLGDIADSQLPEKFRVMILGQPKSGKTLLSAILPQVLNCLNNLLVLISFRT